ncbi:MAG TPA: fibrobacter succinogenes major paralogous domain-containing protein [Bacteroidales bacterium]|nr:fibrobacter succinogenes major paralogous domain-containing protein [Bacteroidales bacterium]
MKKSLLVLLNGLAPLVLFCQTTVTLNFSGLDSIGQYPAWLDSVYVKNSTRYCDTTLYGLHPSLVLTATWPVGLDEREMKPEKDFWLQSSIPNPFHESAVVRLFRSYAGPLYLRLTNEQGKLLAGLSGTYDKGILSFKISSGETGLLLLTISDNHHLESIKMVSAGQQRTGSIIEYSGLVDNSDPEILKSSTNSSFTFFLGDQLNYTGFSTGYCNAVIFDQPLADTNYLFYFNEPALPAVITAEVTGITDSSAICGGNVTENGYPPVSARGVCWSTEENPTLDDPHTTDGSGLGEFISHLSGLTPQTIYHVRAYATNGTGTTYGEDISFPTTGETVIDVDGNVYQTVVIGNQKWLLENLKVTHYRNGDEIPNVTDGPEWMSLSTGAYCWYDNNITYKDLYGALYNWYTVVDSRQLCPDGWHVPGSDEFQTIVDLFGGYELAGGALKSTRTDPDPHPRWDLPNEGATNESGFTGLPAGRRTGSTTYNFSHLGKNHKVWSTTQTDADHANYLKLDYGVIYGNVAEEGKRYGHSVRCIED